MSAWRNRGSLISAGPAESTDNLGCRLQCHVKGVDGGRNASARIYQNYTCKAYLGYQQATLGPAMDIGLPIHSRVHRSEWMGKPTSRLRGLTVILMLGLEAKDDLISIWLFTYCENTFSCKNKKTKTKCENVKIKGYDNCARSELLNICYDLRLCSSFCASAIY